MHARVRLEKARDRQGVLVVPRHAQRKRPDPAHHEPRVERREHAALGAQVIPRARHGDVVSCDDARDDVRVSREVLGRRVKHRVRAERDGPGVERAREGVVHHHPRVVLAGDGADERDVDAVERGVAGRLEHDEPGLGQHRVFVVLR